MEGAYEDENEAGGEELGAELELRSSVSMDGGKEQTAL